MLFSDLLSAFKHFKRGSKMSKVRMSLMILTLVSMGFLAKGQTLTDGQIIHIMKTTNEEATDLGKVAKSKADNKYVKEFAVMMIDTHKQSEKDIKEVARKTNIKPVKNETSKNLERDVKTKENDLKKLKGSEFDKAYIDQQIAMHQQLLEDLNSKFIPAAQHQELKTYLETTKTHVQEHLSKAQEIQTSLMK
jgi:putative membrane protein